MLWDSRDLGDLGFSALVQPLKRFHSPGTTIATPCWRASQEAAHAAARLLHAKRNSSRGPTLFFTDISSVRYDVCRRVGCAEYYAESCAAIELHWGGERAPEGPSDSSSNAGMNPKLYGLTRAIRASILHSALRV